MCFSPNFRVFFTVATWTDSRSQAEPLAGGLRPESARRCRHAARGQGGQRSGARHADALEHVRSPVALLVQIRHKLRQSHDPIRNVADLPLAIRIDTNSSTSYSAAGCTAVYRDTISTRDDEKRASE